MTIEFWSNNPTVLFNKEYIFELWPTTNMCYEQKLNAVTRLVILITLLGYFMTMSPRVLVIGVLTMAIIFVLFKLRKQKMTKEILHEGFSSAPLVIDNADSSYLNPVTLDAALKSEFKAGTKKNPFSNVLLSLTFNL